VLLISSDSAHSSVIVVVSVPAAKMSYAMQVVNIIINSFFHLVRIERGNPFCPLSYFKISLSLSPASDGPSFDLADSRFQRIRLRTKYSKY
jgi:hypothetical protein